MMNKEKIILDVLKEYEYLAEKVSNGDYSEIKFVPHKKDNICSDMNFQNRKRLIELILTIRQDLFREDIISRMFEAEIESCRYASYGGFDSSLTKLTAMIWKFNSDERYNEQLEKAKKANFDCECGLNIQQGAYSYSLGTDFISELSAAECLNYIYFDLCDSQHIIEYLDMYENQYYNSVSDLEKIKFINNSLGRKDHNLRYYQLRLESALQTYSDREIAFSYSSVIDVLISYDLSYAYEYFEEALPYLFRIEEWHDCGLGWNYIEYAAEFIINSSEYREALKNNWKKYIGLYKDDNSNMGRKCRMAYNVLNSENMK